MLKRCTVCKVEKPLDDFGARKAKRDGKRSECKPCAQSASRLYSEANPEKRKASEKASRDRHRVVRCERVKSYYRENPDKRRESQRKTLRLRWQAGALNSARSTARARGYAFDLTQEYLLELFERQGGRCYWLGIPMVPSVEKRDPRRPSVDRIDASKGYVKGNVAIACTFANMGRSATEHDKFRAFITELVSALGGANQAT